MKLNPREIFSKNPGIPRELKNIIQIKIRNYKQARPIQNDDKL